MKLVEYFSAYKILKNLFHSFSAKQKETDPEGQRSVVKPDSPKSKTSRSTGKQKTSSQGKTIHKYESDVDIHTAVEKN